MNKNRRVNIVICGERYSRNVGDGVISDCISYLIMQLYPNANISHIDFSRKSVESNSSIKKNYNIRSLVNRAYRFISRYSFYKSFISHLVFLIRSRPRLNKIWDSGLTNIDLAIIGGGQLFLDSPTHRFIYALHDIAHFCEKKNIPFIFYSCGVGSNWSSTGKYLINAIFPNSYCKYIVVRDNKSRSTLLDISPKITDISVTFDPALFTADTYHVETDHNSNTIGVGIISPDVVSLNTKCTEETLTRFWVNLIQELSKRHSDIVLFTNGNQDDAQYASKIKRRIIENHALNIELYETAKSPRMLVEQISSFKALIAHRLHANIVAYSLGIPSVGLSWDQKVISFGEMCGRSKYFLLPDLSDHNSIADLVDEAIFEGIDKQRLELQKSKSLEDLKLVLVGLLKYEA